MYAKSISSLLRGLVAIVLISMAAITMLTVKGAMAEGIVYDPADLAGKSVSVVCTLPTTRTDGTPLPASEIAAVNFYRSNDKTSWTDLGTSSDCSLLLDTESMPEAQYYITAEVVDKKGGVSPERATALPFVLRRAAPPGSATELRIQLQGLE